MQDNLVLSAQHVTKHFGDIAAVKDIDLHVKTGELFGLVGPDGAGKSTLLRILAGALSYQGEVNLWEQSLHKQRARLCEQIGYVPQRFSLYGDLTIMENLRFVGRLYGMSGADVQSTAAPLLDWAGLTPFSGRQAAFLSGGMKQKLSLIAALLHSARLLLLDEPTTAVDPVARIDFWQMLRELSGQGVTVVVSTVYLDEAGQCDRLALMHTGQFLAQGTPAELRQKVPYQVFETVARSQDRTTTEARIRQLPGVVQVVPYGSRFRVHTEKECLVDTAIWATQLEAAGVTAQIRPVQVSMEDVFVYLLELKEASAA